MPSTAEYFSFLSKELQSRSQLIREWYSTHKPSAGSNREYLLQKMFSDILPPRYTISSGLAISCSGEFSNQSDIFIVDALNNKPLIDAAVPVWLIESVYTLIEVKTYLGPAETTDPLKKCQKFKRLKRNFSANPSQAIKETLFIVWTYDSPQMERSIKNISEAACEIEDCDLPDFIISPSKFVVRSGTYETLANYGQPGSSHRERFISSGGTVTGRRFTAIASEKHCFMMFLIWLLSWLEQAGPRSADLISYLSQEETYGNSIEGIFRRK